MDGRKKEEVIGQIKDKALCYVPEWKFDEEFPDGGTALAYVYADMLSKTIQKFNKVALKNQIAFLNALDASLLPAVPATGYTVFSLVNNEVPGTIVSAGTILTGQTDDSVVQSASFETKEDVYVTPAEIECIYQTGRQQDYIGKIYDKNHQVEEIVLFGFHQTNLQYHEFHFCHEEAFAIKGNAWISVEFLKRDSYNISTEILEQLVKKEQVVFEYLSEEGYCEFSGIQLKESSICFLKGELQPKFKKAEIEGKEGCWIRCRVKQIDSVKFLEFDNFYIKVKGIAILPDSIYANGTEGTRRYFPFGERLSNYSEWYLSSEEVLCKKGAEVELAFQINFVKIPLDYNVENDPIKWEWIMKKSDFERDPEYDITIEEVIWEYYNGLGWRRLFEDSRYSDIFSVQNDSPYRKVKFTCPLDIQPILVNSSESLFIRARVVKVNNFLKMKGSYVSPVLESTSFSYEYTARKCNPTYLISKNNLDVRAGTYKKLLSEGAFQPFQSLSENNQMLYMGFQTAPVGEPIKMLVLLKDCIERSYSNLFWEYYNGHGWKSLNIIDETENLSKSGIINFIGNKDFKKLKLFGRELYWIRICDGNGYYGSQNGIQGLPRLSGIYLNATKIEHVEKKAEEYFMMESFQESRKFALTGNHIIDIQVYVNEINSLSNLDEKSLRKEGRFAPVYDESGMLTEAWVKWICVPDFVLSSQEDRHFIIDKNEGYIVFGNGRQGRIPSISRRKNIRVSYSCGGGNYANVPAGGVKKINQSIGYINKVFNPEALTGGADMEALEGAIKRSTAVIRHQNRAITIRDYEELTLAASRNVKKVKCFSGCDGSGDKLSGAITLVVLQSDYQNSKSLFHVLKKDLLAFLKDKVNDNLLLMKKLFIVEPVFVKLNVKVEIVVGSLQNLYQVKKMVSDRLNQFIDPMTGNFHGNGWSIGSLPNTIQIQNAINTIPGVLYIRKVFISAFVHKNTGLGEVQYEEIQQNKYSLPVSGEHEIEMMIEEG
ncbi:baseplate J/gp47 family protein [Anaeromicropila populeti]|nr:baseplate J/gp47 family protein [Anaeromicropila populeti]